jgi:hypothetical protein
MIFRFLNQFQFYSENVSFDLIENEYKQYLNYREKTR